VDNKKLNDDTKRGLTTEKENKKVKGIEDIEEKSNQDTIKFLVKGLSDKNGLIRRSYAEELGKIGKSTLPELIHALLNSKDVIQRRAAAKTLKLVKDPSALPHLIQALTNDSDPVVQCSAAGAIAIFGETAVNHLVILLENPEHSEMQHGLATWCLAFIGAKAPNLIKKAAQSKNTKVKSAAISALEEHIRQSNDKESIQLVKNSINDSAKNVQIEAIRLVGKLHRIESLIPDLISKLKNKSPEIRQASVLSLMQLNIKESLNQLQELLRFEKNKNVKKIIELAIQTIDAKEI
jgi:bilin biosynthesis protein